MTTPKTRLDVVVKLRDREEERARKELCSATETTRRAEAAKETARAASLSDDRARGDSANWLVSDLAQARALSELRVATDQVRTAAQGETQARAKHLHAWRDAEAVRKAAESRREELGLEERRAERRESDDLAGILFFRKAM